MRSVEDREVYPAYSLQTTRLFEKIFPIFPLWSVQAPVIEDFTPDIVNGSRLPIFWPKAFGNTHPRTYCAVNVQPFPFGIENLARIEAAIPPPVHPAVFCLMSRNETRLANAVGKINIQ